MKEKEFKKQAKKCNNMIDSRIEITPLKTKDFSIEMMPYTTLNSIDTNRVSILNDDWAMDNDDFDDFTKDKPIEKKPFFKRIIDPIALFYWANFRIFLWKIKNKIKNR